jgi:predicted metal-dependent phosphoesterase TrpH
LIDLHCHSNESDGTASPAELVAEACRLGLEALSITDHDTFAGHDLAVPLAREAGLELVRGIELSTKRDGHSVHLLAYFMAAEAPAFDEWVRDMQRSRRDRNLRLAARLRELGLEVTIEEVEAKGRGMTGRPHFAQVLIEKGYVANRREAFDEYLDESAKGYVHRREPQLEEAIRKIRAAGGVAALAHPGRVKGDLVKLLPELCAAGLNAIEVYHSDHSPQEVARYAALAERFSLAMTGGSDYHGDNKPGLLLGTGENGNVAVPRAVLDRLRDLVL